MPTLGSLAAEMFGDATPAQTEREARARLRAGGFPDLFAGDPDFWFLRRYDELLDAIDAAPGLKIRVSAPTRPLLRRLTPLLAVLADTIVFSPSPMWCCQYIEVSEKPWPGFVDHPGLEGQSQEGRTVWYHGGVVNHGAWLAALRPLLTTGRVVFLPRYNWSWEHPRFGFVPLPDVEVPASVPVREVYWIFEDLLREHAVSTNLGCIHLDPSVARHPVGTPGLVDVPKDGAGDVTYALMNLRVPRIMNASYADLSAVLEDETESVLAFRSSLRTAVESVSDLHEHPGDAKRAIDKIQRELIDEPLARLEARLRRLEGIKRRKYASYGIALATVALLPALGAPAWLTTGMGGVSAAKILETYLADVDKSVELHADALYWLSRLPRP